MGDARMQTRFLENSIERFGGIDALVNNAGISGPKSHIEDVDVSDWTNVFRVNVETHFVACKVVVPYLRKVTDR